MLANPQYKNLIRWRAYVARHLASAISYRGTCSLVPGLTLGTSCCLRIFHMREDIYIEIMAQRRAGAKPRSHHGHRQDVITKIRIHVLRSYLFSAVSVS